MTAHLPKGWRYDRLKDVATVNARSLGADTRPDKEIDYLEISNVSPQGIVDRAAIEHLAFGEAPSRARRCVCEGATIVSSVRPNLQAIAYIGKRDAHLICSTGFNVVSPRLASVTPRYLYYCLLSDDAKQYFVATAKGVGYPAIDDKEFGTFDIPLPPRDEQERIAAFLDAKCADVDKAIAAKRRQLAHIDEIWTNALARAVTQGLDVNRTFVETGDYRIPKLPTGWRLVRLKRVAVVSNGSDPVTEGDVPVYGSGGQSFKTCGEYKLGPAVLLGRKGTIDIPRYVEGKYWNVDTAFDVKPLGVCDGRDGVPSPSEGGAADGGRGATALPASRGKIDIRFLYYVAHTFDYRFYSTQTTVPSMTQKDYRNMLLPLPPRGEQERIVAFLDAHRAHLDALAANLRRQVETLEQYRKSLIHECVTGARRCG